MEVHSIDQVPLKHSYADLCLLVTTHNVHTHVNESKTFFSKSHHSTTAQPHVMISRRVLHAVKNGGATESINQGLAPIAQRIAMRRATHCGANWEAFRRRICGENGQHPAKNTQLDDRHAVI